MSTLFNELTHKVVPLDLPNMFARVKNEDADAAPYTVDKFVKPLIMDLARKYPQWRFVCYARTRVCSEFKVFEGREQLGVVGMEYRYGRCGGIYAFTVNNERISNSRSRGDKVRTTNIKKAVVTVSKMFKPKSVGERMVQVKDKANHVIHNVANDRRSSFQMNFGRLVNSLEPYIMENLDKFVEPALAASLPQNLLDKLPTIYNERTMTERIKECYETGKGVVVLIHGSDYAVTQIGTDEIKMYSTDTLPAYVKRGVGMLKLVEDNYFIGNVGARLSEAEFFIIRGESDE